MNPREFSNGESPTDEERRAQLVAAALAVREWVYGRRAAWTDAPLPPPTPRHVDVDEVEPSPLVHSSVEEAADGFAYEQPPAAEPTGGRPAFDEPMPPSMFDEPDETPDRLSIDALTFNAAAYDEAETSADGPGRLAVWIETVRPLVEQWWRPVCTAAIIFVVVAAIGSFARSSWQKLAAAPKTGTAHIDSVPPGSAVAIDGVAVGVTPVTRQLPAGPHTVEFRYQDETRTLEVTIVKGEPTSARLDWTAKPTGRLTVSTDPAGAQVTVDGRDRGMTPLTIDDLVAGTHAVILKSDKGSLRRTVTIAAGATEQLSESIYPGWVRVVSPIELEVREGSTLLRLDDRGQVLLAPGSHDLKIANAAFGYTEVHHVDIKPGAMTMLSIVPPASKLSVTASAPAEVLVDGDRIGDTPLANHPVNLGTRDIVVRGAAGERRFTMTVTVKPVHIDVDFSKP